MKKCPKCSGTDTRSCSVIWREGTTESRGSIVGGSFGGGGFRPAAASTFERSESLLAQQCAPPQKRSEWSVVLAMLAFLFALNLGFTAAWLLGIPLVILGVFLAQHFVRARSYNRDEYPSAVRRWESTFVCSRCGTFLKPPAAESRGIEQTDRRRLWLIAAIAVLLLVGAPRFVTMSRASSTPNQESFEASVEVDSTLADAEQERLVELSAGLTKYLRDNFSGGEGVSSTSWYSSISSARYFSHDRVRVETSLSSGDVESIEAIARAVLLYRSDDGNSPGYVEITDSNGNPLLSAP